MKVVYRTSTVLVFHYARILLGLLAFIPEGPRPVGPAWADTGGEAVVSPGRRGRRHNPHTYEYCSDYCTVRVQCTAADDEARLTSGLTLAEPGRTCLTDQTPLNWTD